MPAAAAPYTANVLIVKTDIQDKQHGMTDQVHVYVHVMSAIVANAGFDSIVTSS